MTLYLQTFWRILVEIAPFVILGMLAAGLLHETLGRFTRLRTFALRRGFWSLSVFNLAGFTLPICSCGVIPLAVGLRRQTVPLGNIFSFVYAAPATSIAAVILSLAVFGPGFTLLYCTGAIACGYLIGLVFYLAEPARTSDARTRLIDLGESGQTDPAAPGFLARAVRWGTIDYGSRIAFDLLVGLALAALIVATYSVHDLTGWIGEMPFWQAALIMIAVAIPLYVCSIPGILVGGALVLGGLTPGLLWIFLMAGPVTNLGDINVLRHNLGWRNTLLYIAAVVTSTLIWGWVIETTVDWSELWVQVRAYYADQAQAGTGGGIADALAGASWLGIPRGVHTASAALVIGLTVNGAWLTLREIWSNPCRHCAHYQRDLRLNPAICSQPCWKRRALRLFRFGTAAPKPAQELRKSEFHADRPHSR